MRRSLLALALCLVGIGNAAAQTAQSAPPAPSADESDAASDPSIGGLFVELWHDLPRMASRSNLVILGSSAAASLAIQSHEAEWVVRAHQSEELGDIFSSYPGSGWIQITGAVGTYVVGRATGNAKATSVGTDLVQAQLLDGVLVTGVKYASQRKRPDGGHHSFPSGHTSSIFASAAVLSRHFGWRVGVPAYSLASYVGVARVQEQHHYVSDVVFGAALGIVSGRTVTVGKRSTPFQVAPVATAGGGAVILTRTW